MRFVLGVMCHSASVTFTGPAPSAFGFRGGGGGIGVLNGVNSPLLPTAEMICVVFLFVLR